MSATDSYGLYASVMCGYPGGGWGTVVSWELHHCNKGFITGYTHLEVNGPVWSIHEILRTVVDSRRFLFLLLYSSSRYLFAVKKVLEFTMFVFCFLIMHYSTEGVAH